MRRSDWCVSEEDMPSPEVWWKGQKWSMPRWEPVFYRKAGTGDFLHFMLKNGIHPGPMAEPFMAAEINGKIAGVIYTSVSWIKTFSFDVAVNRAHRKKGIGTELVRFALEKFENLKHEGKVEYCMVEVISTEMKRILEQNFDLRVSHTNTNHQTGKRSIYMTDLKEEEEDGEGNETDKP